LFQSNSATTSPVTPIPNDTTTAMASTMVHLDVEGFSETIVYDSDDIQKKTGLSMDQTLAFSP